MTEEEKKEYEELKELEEFEEFEELFENYSNYIVPKSKIQEKIDEYMNLLMSCNRFSDVDRIKAINERILTLKELLEE